MNENVKNAVLTATNLEFAYRPGAPVLRDVGLIAQPGEFLCLLGPNGSGKTTLLRCLMGRLCPQAGRVTLDDRPVDKHSPRELARRLAYVPQQPASAFALPVREIVLAGRLAHTGMLSLAGQKDLEIAHLAMEMTETAEFADRCLGELSGGEAQRVMIARALAQQPAVCLLDEPTSHLDIRNQLMIYRMMRRLADEWSMAVVCVSHDVNLAARFADRLMLMRHGCLVADGAVSEVLVESTLAETYDVEVELIPVSNSAPLVRAK